MTKAHKSNKPKTIVIGVCGRSCSGKSTITKKIETKYMDKVVRVSADKFMKSYKEEEIIKKILTYLRYKEWSWFFLRTIFHFIKAFLLTFWKVINI